jgi:hypothetical protein
MTSEEFSLHLAYWAVEPSGPLGDVQRWAALMAAVVNGPRKRKGNASKPFTLTDFWPANAWSEAPPPPTPGAKPARMAPDLSHMRGMRVNNRRR